MRDHRDHHGPFAWTAADSDKKFLAPPSGPSLACDAARPTDSCGLRSCPIYLSNSEYTSATLGSSVRSTFGSLGLRVMCVDLRAIMVTCRLSWFVSLCFTYMGCDLTFFTDPFGCSLCFAKESPTAAGSKSHYEIGFSHGQRSKRFWRSSGLAYGGNSSDSPQQCGGTRWDEPSESSRKTSSASGDYAAQRAHADHDARAARAGGSQDAPPGGEGQPVLRCHLREHQRSRSMLEGLTRLCQGRANGPGQGHFGGVRE